MGTISSTKTVILDLPPSCIEFWPQDGRYFVVGTYYLEKPADVEGVNPDGAQTANNPQKRSGSMVLFRVDGDDV